MKKRFETPFYKVVYFGNSDIFSESSCCDMGGGITFDDDDEACVSRDANCSCGEDIDQNCG